MKHSHAGPYLRECRRKSGKGVHEVGGEIGTTGAFISQVETGNKIPIERIPQLAKAIGADEGTLRLLWALDNRSIPCEGASTEQIARAITALGTPSTVPDPMDSDSFRCPRCGGVLSVSACCASRHCEVIQRPRRRA